MQRLNKTCASCRFSAVCLPFGLQGLLNILLVTWMEFPNDCPMYDPSDWQLISTSDGKLHTVSREQLKNAL